jgi:hypothetical protein
MVIRDSTPLAGGIVIVVLVFLGYLVLEAIDRVTESPAMRRRVNAGSDKFLNDRGTVWQAASRGATEFLARHSGYWHP